jgi:Myosin head (motor domain)
MKHGEIVGGVGLIPTRSERRQVFLMTIMCLIKDWMMLKVRGRLAHKPMSCKLVGTNAFESGDPLHISMVIPVYLQDREQIWVKAVTEGKVENGIVKCRVVGDPEELRAVKVGDYSGLSLPKQNETNEPDLTNLKFLHEANIFYCLKDRYLLNDEIYTRSGDLIISINPFRWIENDPLYCEKTRNLYANRLVWDTTSTDPRTELPPHVFEVRFCLQELGGWFF